MTLTLYPESAGAGDARSLAKAHGWRQRERPMCLDPWFLCREHKAWRPEE